MSHEQLPESDPLEESLEHLDPALLDDDDDLMEAEAIEIIRRLGAQDERVPASITQTVTLSPLDDEALEGESSSELDLADMDGIPDHIKALLGKCKNLEETVTYGVEALEGGQSSEEEAFVSRKDERTTADRSSAGESQQEPSPEEQGPSKTTIVAHKLLQSGKPVHFKHFQEYGKRLSTLTLKEGSFEHSFLDRIGMNLIGMHRRMDEEGIIVYDGLILLGGILFGLLERAGTSPDPDGGEDYHQFHAMLKKDLDGMSTTRLAQALIAEKKRNGSGRRKRPHTERKPIPLVEAQGWSEFNESVSAFNQLNTHLQQLVQKLRPVRQSKSFNPNLDVRNRALVTFRIQISNNAKRLLESATRVQKTYHNILAERQKKGSMERRVPVSLQEEMKKTQGAIDGFKQVAGALFEAIEAEFKLSEAQLRRIREPFPKTMGRLRDPLMRVIEIAKQKYEKASVPAPSIGSREMTEERFAPPKAIFRGSYGNKGAFPSIGMVYSSTHKWKEGSETKEKPVILVYCPVLTENIPALEKAINAPQKAGENPHSPCGIYIVKNPSGIHGFPPGGVIIEYPHPGDITILNEATLQGIRHALPETFPVEHPHSGESHFNAQRYSQPLPIGKGARGIVFKVKDRKHNQWIALKAPLDAAESAALAREHELTKNVAHHQAITSQEILYVQHPLQSYGFAPNMCLLQLELLERSMEPFELFVDRVPPSVKKRGPAAETTWRAPHVLDLAIDVCSALEAAQEQNIVNCDVKPQNMQTQKKYRQHGYETFLLDWGAARKVGEKAADASKTYCMPEAFGHEGGYTATPDHDAYAVGASIGVLLLGDKDPWKFGDIAEKFFGKRNGLDLLELHNPDFNTELKKRKITFDPFSPEELEKRVPKSRISQRNHIVSLLLAIASRATRCGYEDIPTKRRFADVSELKSALVDLKEALRKAAEDRKKAETARLRRAKEAEERRLAKKAQEEEAARMAEQERLRQRDRIARAIQDRKTKSDTSRTERLEKPSDSPGTQKLSRKDLYWSDEGELAPEQTAPSRPPSGRIITPKTPPPREKPAEQVKRNQRRQPGTSGRLKRPSSSQQNGHQNPKES